MPSEGKLLDLLGSYDRRRRSTSAARNSLRMLAAGSLCSLALLTLLWWTGRATPFPIWGLAPTLLGLVPLLGRLFGGQELAETAADLDRDQGYDDLLKTGLGLAARSSAERAVQDLEVLTVARAADRLTEQTPRAVLPWKLQKGALAISGLAPLLLALVVLSHQPGAQRVLGQVPGLPSSADGGDELADLASLDDAEAMAEEAPVEPELPPELTAPKIPIEGLPAELSDVARLGEQIDVAEALELSELRELTGATAEEIAEMLQRASETKGDDLVEEETRRQEDAGPTGDPADQGGDESLAEPRPGPETHEGRSAEASEGAEGGEDAAAQQMEIPSPFKPQLEQAQAQSQAGEQMIGMDMGAQGAENEPASGQPNEGDAAGSFGDATAPQGEEVLPFGLPTEMPVTLEIAIVEAQKQEEKIEGEKRERESAAQEATVGFRRVQTPSEVSAAHSITRESVSWLHRDLVRDYFLKLEAVLEAEAEREREEGAQP